MCIELGIFLELPSAWEGTGQAPLERVVYKAWSPCSWFNVTSSQWHILGQGAQTVHPFSTLTWIDLMCKYCPRHILLI